MTTLKMLPRTLAGVFHSPVVSVPRLVSVPPANSRKDIAASSRSDHVFPEPAVPTSPSHMPSQALSRYSTRFCPSRPSLRRSTLSTHSVEPDPEAEVTPVFTIRLVTPVGTTYGLTSPAAPVIVAQAPFEGPREAKTFSVCAVVPTYGMTDKTMDSLPPV